EEVEMLPDCEGVEEDVVLRAESDRATDLEHRKRRTLSSAVVTEQSSYLTLKRHLQSNSFLKKEAPYVFERPAMLTVASISSCSASVFNLFD
ncbi:hypothetical protein PMAYCL1PPCAC_10672, partial [Pristionchus mayeri]